MKATFARRLGQGLPITPPTPQPAPPGTTRLKPMEDFAALKGPSVSAPENGGQRSQHVSNTRSLRCEEQPDASLFPAHESSGRCPSVGILQGKK